MEINYIIGQVLDACIKIHTEIGPGLFESVYEKVLYRELSYNRRMIVEVQKTLPIIYEGYTFNEAFRIDLLVENQVIIEIKSIENLLPVHYKQVLTYLKLANLKNGILVNFNVDLIKNGFHRVFNNHIK